MVVATCCVRKRNAYVAWPCLGMRLSIDCLTSIMLALMFSWLPIHGHSHVMFYVNNRVVFQHTDTIHVNTSLTASRNVIHILSLASFPGSSPAIVAYIQYGNETSTCAHFIYSMGMRPVYTLYIQCGNETSTCAHFICSIGTRPVYTLRPRFAF